KKGWKEIKGKVGYIPQNLGLVKNMDVKTNILLGALGRTSLLPSLFGMMTVDDHRKADEIMKQVGIEHLKNNSVKTLSGGEKRRVAIARALLHGPEVLVADELLSELDGISAENVSRQIKKLQEENGTSIILIEHNIEAARALADTLIVLSEGQIVAIVDSNDTDHYNQVRTLLAHD
ncbi:MAG: ATP-binding cassette domain-containing protein, partial [Candidatus Kariarchaeaceae archaeon]